jgi:fluoroquinolone transport system ATP-binding protein
MISVKDVKFSYSKQPFVEDVSFDVKEGEIFGFLGPSGAGKSTLQKIMTGIITTYEGSVKVNGIEVKNRNHEFYEDIGVDFEFPSFFDKLTARENLDYFASLYKHPYPNNEKLLKQVGLHNDADKKVSGFSKGMKSRLNFIKALIHSPKILFLDEPTSGLDPSNVAVMKDMILKEKARGKTIILTTHNMYDAAELCDRVAFFVDGKIRTIDSPRNLIMAEGGERLVYSYEENGHEVTGTSFIDDTASDEKLQSLICGNKLISIHSTEPTLNEIFVKITGRTLV